MANIAVRDAVRKSALRQLGTIKNRLKKYGRTKDPEVMAGIADEFFRLDDILKGASGYGAFSTKRGDVISMTVYTNHPATLVKGVELASRWIAGLRGALGS